MSDTLLQIGPIVFTHQVQKISVQERRAVAAMETTRTSKNYLVTNHDSSNQAQIRLLFTGLDEINTYLRKLIALFRCCPITSCKNEYLVTTWKTEKDSSRTLDDLLNEDVSLGNDILNLNPKATIQYIPITLESLTLENVPDLTEAIQVTLVIGKADVTAVTETGELLYAVEKGPEYPGDINPDKAYWLNKWLNQLLEQGEIPSLSASDFRTMHFDWYGIGSDNNPLKNSTHAFDIDITTNHKSQGIALSESCTVTNKFAYNRTLSATCPTPMHMGATSMFCSIDMVFNNQVSSESYEAVCKFKDTADQQVRSAIRYDRIDGWVVTSPIMKLLHRRRNADNQIPGNPYGALLVPVQISSETADTPSMINMRIDLIENNLDFFSDNEIVYLSGGSDYGRLKKYYDKIVDQEFSFRKQIVSKKGELASQLAGQSDRNPDYESYRLFWPIETNLLRIKEESGFGIINIDTLRALLLHPTVDTDGALKSALLKSKLATGAVAIGASNRVKFLDKAVTEWEVFKAIFDGVNLEDPEIANIRKAILDISPRLFSIRDYPTHERFSDYLTIGLLGDRTNGLLLTKSATGLVLKELSVSNFELTHVCKEALFDIVIKRDRKNPYLPYIYSTDGIYSGFYKLISAYSLDSDTVLSDPDARREEIRDANRNNKVDSVYPDLLLPTYVELYGPDRWTEFAPSLDDLGVDHYDDQTSKTRAELSAVRENDYVSPAAWFYIKRVKNTPEGVRQFSEQATDAVNSISQEFSLSMPFNTSELEELKKAMADDNITDKPGTTSKTVEDIILRAVERHEKNKSAFREDVIKLSNAFGQKFADKYYTQKNNITFYVHHNGNYVLPKQVTIPGLGAQIYRVLKNHKKLDIADKLSRFDADEEMVTPIQKEIKYHRHLDDTTRMTIKSMIDQIPDDQYSVERLFPAIKIYLVDRRGTDLVMDDTLFVVAGIVSVDITLDKDDADLAVIKLADPLYTLQSDFFESDNIIDLEREAGVANKKVLNSLREQDKDSYVKRYKLAQGRAIQIRMGYSSMAYNLPIVFTGRITEIVPGDQLTIVAQGWKAELINRQVSFYNDQPKNWGARDLAIQSIVYSNPDGFGDYYPEFDSRFILSHLDNPDVQTMLTQVMSNFQNIDLTDVGTTSLFEEAKNGILNSIGINTSDNSNRGFDTRLKNIWYPDTEKYSNIFGLRTRFGLMPSWVNDSWIIPLQPAWDALKEASRHAWNCIVQVIPYDTQATIFMGHPDQMYYYTKGNSYAKSKWNKYNTKKKAEVKATMEQLVYGNGTDTLGFVNSSYFHDPQNDLANLSKRGLFITEFNRLTDEKKEELSFPQIHDLKSLATLSSYAPYYYLVDQINNSTLPAVKLEELIDSGIYNDIHVYLFGMLYGIDRNTLYAKWPSVSRDLKELLSRNADLNDLNKSVSELFNKVNVNQSELTTISDSLKSFIKFFFEDPKNSILASFVSIGRLDYAVTNMLENRDIAVVRMKGILLSLERFTKTSTVSKPVLNVVNILNNFILLLSAKSVSIPAITKLVNDDYKILVAANEQLVIAATTVDSSTTPIMKKLGINVSSGGQFILSTFHIYKAFVYCFARYVLEVPSAMKLVNQIPDKTSEKIPPFMKTFRLHHYIDDKRNIIQNNLVATTREMWNTVVIEHPAPGTAETNVKSDDNLFTRDRLNAGANWNYYPKQEVTGVIGLQYHPGLTLANKKIRVFTELNCQTPSLAAKLACHHLAEGIKKMYRGTIGIIGKHVKPYDRMIMADNYTKMTGPVEVESVTHHWNSDMGWVTNLVPSAVCDANAGAGILQTAILETTYQAVFNTLEFASDVLTIATIVATLGAATPLAAGRFGITKGLTLAAKKFAESPKNYLPFVLKNYGQSGKVALKTITKNFSLASGKKLEIIRQLYRRFGGPVNSLLKNEVRIAGAEFATHLWFKLHVIPSFVDSTKDVDQLPVTLSPLIFNGVPFTAGLEAEDAIWGISAFGAYYSAQEMLGGVARLWNDLFEDV